MIVLYMLFLRVLTKTRANKTCQTYVCVVLDPSRRESVEHAHQNMLLKSAKDNIILSA